MKNLLSYLFLSGLILAANQVYAQSSNTPAVEAKDAAYAAYSTSALEKLLYRLISRTWSDQIGFMA